VLAATIGAVKGRHLQEVSHFAVHGALFKTARMSNALTEALAHVPMGFGPVVVRQARHVRDHHPNAAVPGLDPNLTELATAGLAAGIAATDFVLAVLFPLTGAGLSATVRGLVGNLHPRRGWWRLVAFCIAPAAAMLLGGVPLLLAGFVVPRLLLYPQLAWVSLLVEHSWFDAPAPVGDRRLVEYGRCVRLYQRRRLWSVFARATWLPYGDLMHYAHSVHPGLRWNYLAAADALLGPPRTVYPTLAGRTGALAALWRTTVQRPASGLVGE